MKLRRTAGNSHHQQICPSMVAVWKGGVPLGLCPTKGGVRPRSFAIFGMVGVGDGGEVLSKSKIAERWLFQHKAS